LASSQATLELQSYAYVPMPSQTVF